MTPQRAVVVLTVLVAVGFGLWWFALRTPGPAGGGETEAPATPAIQPAGGRSEDDQRAPPARRRGNRAAEAGTATSTGGSVRTVVPSTSAVATPGGDGTTCDDGDPCTFRDRIRDGVCSGQPHCDDENPLTVDSCTGDGCAHAFVPGAFESLQTGAR